MQHESEHVVARDALLLVAAALAVVVCPWNLCLWWQRKWLRDAVELDCDARVLRAGANPAAYGALLVDVARRSAGIPRAAIALAEPPSLLARRVVMLISSKVRARAAKAMLGIAVGGLLVALACETPHPLGPTLPISLQQVLPDSAADSHVQPMRLNSAEWTGWPRSWRGYYSVVVDIDGRPIPTSFVMDSITDPSAAALLRERVLSSRFRPATVDRRQSQSEFHSR